MKEGCVKRGVRGKPELQFFLVLGIPRCEKNRATGT